MIEVMGTYVFHSNVLYFDIQVNRMIIFFNDSMDLLFSYIILFKYLLNTDNKELSRKLFDLNSLRRSKKDKGTYHEP